MKKILKGKHGPLLIAEIGGNHGGDFEYAKRLTQLAIDADVDMIKFQIYTGDSLVSKLESPKRNKHFKKFELTNEQHVELAQMVTDSGLLYSSSVWDLDAISWLDKFIAAYKIGSGDLTAYPILRETAKIGKPIILSTGLSSEEEVLNTIKFIQKVNNIYMNPEMLCVLQCTSMYPIDFSDAHLNVIRRLKKLTNLKVGYSDHTEGTKAIVYAISMGAEIVEFHFTDRRDGQSFRDHKVSLLPKEVVKIIDEIETINKLKGSKIKKPIKIEIDSGHNISFRRAVYPKIDLKEGSVLTTDNITVLRPNHGIDARDYDKVLGKTLIKPLKAHEKMSWDILK